MASANKAVMSPHHFIRHVPRYRTVSKHTSYAGLPAIVRIAAELIIEELVRFCQQFIPNRKSIEKAERKGVDDVQLCYIAREGPNMIFYRKIRI